MQNQPDQTTLSMSEDADGLILSEARDATTIDDLEDASFDFYGGVSSLIEQAPQVTVALRRAVAVVHTSALFFAGQAPTHEERNFSEEVLLLRINPVVTFGFTQPAVTVAQPSRKLLFV